MRLVSSLVALACAATAFPAAANNWRLASTAGAQPDRSHFYVDVDSISRNGDEITFTTMSVYERSTDKRDFDLSINRRRGSCSAMSSQIVSGRYFAAGKLLENNTTPGDMVTSNPGSIIYGTMMAACGKRDWQGAVTTNPEGVSRGKFKNENSFGGH